MVKDAIKNGGSDRDITVKDIRPVLECFMGVCRAGRNDHGVELGLQPYQHDQCRGCPHPGAIMQAPKEQDEGVPPPE